MAELVSAIIATRDRPLLLERAVRSVVAQTYRPIEAIVVDENDPGSEARAQTAAVLDRVRVDSGDVAITHLRDRSPTWVCRARNDGVQAASGSILAFLDDDDWWKAEKIARQVRLLSAGGTAPALVYTGLEVVDGEGAHLKDRRPTLRGNLLPDLLVENVIGTPSSVAMRRDVFLELGGFDPVFPTRHDLDLYLRVAERHAIEVVPEPLTVYVNQNPQAMSKHFDNKMEGRRLIRQKHARHYDGRPLVQARYEYGTALLCLKHGRPGQARDHLRASLALRFTPRAFIRLVLTKR